MSKKYQLSYLYRTEKEAKEVANVIVQKKFVKIIQDSPSIGRSGSCGQLSLPDAFSLVLVEFSYIYNNPCYRLAIIRKNDKIKSLDIIDRPTLGKLTCYQKQIKLDLGERKYTLSPTSPWVFETTNEQKFVFKMKKPIVPSEPKDYFDNDLVKNELYIGSAIQGRQKSQVVGKIQKSEWDSQANRFTYFIECGITNQIVRCKSVMRISSLEDDMFEAKIRN